MFGRGVDPPSKETVMKQANRTGWESARQRVCVWTERELSSGEVG